MCPPVFPSPVSNTAVRVQWYRSAGHLPTLTSLLSPGPCQALTCASTHLTQRAAFCPFAYFMSGLYYNLKCSEKHCQIMMRSPHQLPNQCQGGGTTSLSQAGQREGFSPSVGSRTGCEPGELLATVPLAQATPGPGSRSHGGGDLQGVFGLHLPISTPAPFSSHYGLSSFPPSASAWGQRNLGN